MNSGITALGFLKQHRRVTYTNLLASGITEQLKDEDAFEWTERVNNIRAYAR